MTRHALAEDHLICPIGVPIRIRIGHAGQELAPASTAMVDRLLWRHRARPSATLDKMRTKLLRSNHSPPLQPASRGSHRAGGEFPRDRSGPGPAWARGVRAPNRTGTGTS